VCSPVSTARASCSKTIVVAAVEVRGRGTGRIRLGVVPDVSGPSLAGFVKTAVAPGSTVRTDGWQGYAPLKQRGYDHRPTTQGAPKGGGDVVPAGPQGLHSPQDVGLGHSSRCEPEHLPHYLNEFVFRFNRRRTPMAAFQSLLGLAGQHGPRPTSPMNVCPRAAARTCR
jgi:hypothetical protein